MNNRSTDPDVAEDQTGRVPISRLFSRKFDGQLQPPTYSFADVIADLKGGVETGEVQELTVTDISDLEIICQGYVRESLQFGSETSVQISLEDGYDDRDLTMDDALALALYSAEIDGKGVYRSMNTAMRRPDRTGVGPYLRFAWMLLIAMSRCQAYQGRLVCRGMRIPDIRVFSVDRVLTWHAFNSCSTDVPAATSFLRDRVGTRDGFTKALFIIELTTYRGRCVSRYSVIPDEKEVLLPPNTSFRVVSQPVDAGDFHIIHLCEVPSKDPLLPLPQYKTPLDPRPAVIMTQEATQEPNREVIQVV